MRAAGFFYTFVYILLLLAAFVLPYFSAEGYNVVRHSLSELGAQSAPNGWMMNAVFILLSAVTAWLGTIVLRRFWLPFYLLCFFVISLGLTAIYHHAPITETLYLEREHVMHSIFSTITGVVFSVYCVAMLLTLQHRLDKALAFFMLCLAVGLSLLIVIFPDFTGVFQRVLFFTAFGWIFYSLVTFKVAPKINQGRNQSHFQQ